MVSQREQVAGNQHGQKVNDRRRPQWRQLSLWVCGLSCFWLEIFPGRLLGLWGQMGLPDQATPSVALDGWPGGGSPYLELCSKI